MLNYSIGRALFAQEAGMEASEYFRKAEEIFRQEGNEDEAIECAEWRQKCG